MGGYCGGRLTLMQLQEGQSPKHDTNRLNSTTEQSVQLVPMRLG